MRDTNEINKFIGKIADKNELNSEERSLLFELAAGCLDLIFASDPKEEEKLREWLDEETQNAPENIQRAFKQFKLNFH